MDSLQKRASQLADAITAFERESRMAEFTDTGVAWDLLYQARGELRRVARTSSLAPNKATGRRKPA